MKRYVIAAALLLAGLLVSGPATAASTGGQRITGTPRYTQTLTVHTGHWSIPDPTVQVQWRTGGADVDGATDTTYRIRPEDVGHRVIAVLTASAPGYADEQVAVRSEPIAYRIDVRRTVTYSVQTRGRITTSVRQFADLAQQTYDDARGWRSAGIRFVRVAHGGAFTLVLSAAASVPSFSSQCSTMWSCRVGRFVIINQDRWQHASPAWNAAHLTLRDYRDLVVNHETGHWLGLRDIYACPTPGKPAPVMMEQSKNIGSCHFNPWPLPGEIAGRTPSGGPAIDYGRTQVE